MARNSAEEPHKVSSETKVTASKNKINSLAPVLRYVPRSRRKEGESPFVEANEQERPRKLDEKDVELLKETSTIPLTKLSNDTPTKQPLRGFVKPIQGKTEHGTLPEKRTKEGFDPNAYKLLAKAGYDFGSSSKEGDQVIPGKRVHELNESQRRLREQGCTADPTKAGLGFVPAKPIKISGRRKVAKASTQHISVEVIEEETRESKSTSRVSALDRIRPNSQAAVPEQVDELAPRVSVFDRVDTSTSRVSVFNRITQTTTRASVFNRLSSFDEGNKKSESAPRNSALERIQAPKEQQRKKRKRIDDQGNDKEI